MNIFWVPTKCLAPGTQQWVIQPKPHKSVKHTGLWVFSLLFVCFENENKINETNRSACSSFVGNISSQERVLFIDKLFKPLERNEMKSESIDPHHKPQIIFLKVTDHSFHFLMILSGKK